MSKCIKLQFLLEIAKNKSLETNSIDDNSVISQNKTSKRRCATLTGFWVHGLFSTDFAASQYVILGHKVTQMLFLFYIGTATWLDF